MGPSPKTASICFKRRPILLKPPVVFLKTFVRFNAPSYLFEIFCLVMLQEKKFFLFKGMLTKKMLTKFSSWLGLSTKWHLRHASSKKLKKKGRMPNQTNV